MAIGRNSPRISAGAAGFMSHMSRWLGPPSRKIRMQASAVGANVCFRVRSPASALRLAVAREG